MKSRLFTKNDLKNQTDYLTRLFLLMYIFLCITGIGYFFTAMNSGTMALWTYSDEVLEGGGTFAKLINYSKDVCVIIFTFCFFFKQNRFPYVMKEWIAVILIILYGLVLDLLNGQSILCFVAGIRAYIYAFVTYEFCKSSSDMQTIITKILTLMKILLLVQVVAVLLQGTIVGSGIHLGSGSYRMIGLFTNAGTLGSFAIGTVVLFSTIYMVNKQMKRLSYIPYMGLALFLCLASGSRGPFLYSAVFILISLVYRFNIRGRQKLLLIPVSAVTVGGAVLGFLVSYVERGNIMESGSGRFQAWSDLFNMSPVKILLGQGFGVATNTARLMGVSDIAMDSTFTVVIVQFGVFIGLAFGIGFLLFAKSIISGKSDFLWYRVWYVLFVFLFLFSGSLFEQYVLIVPLIIAAFILNEDFKSNYGVKCCK